MATLRFGEPYDSSNPESNHLRWTYPFTLIGKAEEKQVTVEVSPALYATWKNQTGGDFPNPRLALFPFAVDAVGEAGKDGELPDEITKTFNVDSFREYADNPEGQYPFHPEMIEEPAGQEYEVELRSGGQMGFDING